MSNPDHKNLTAGDIDFEKMFRVIKYLVKSGLALSSGIQALENNPHKPSEILMMHGDDQLRTNLLELAQKFEKFVSEEIGIEVKNVVVDADEMTEH